MATYNELIKQIESLTAQAEELRKSEYKSVIAEIRAKMQEHGITVADLRGAPAAKKSTSKVAAKYRNAETGETWSGRGRTPKWLAEAEGKGRSRESFAV